MYEHFTDRARRAVLHAQEEAKLMQRELIGTEHVLLGLITEGGGVAATALKSLGVTLEAAREQAREEDGRRAARPSRTPKFSPAALEVIDRARREATELEQRVIGTEHLLLSLLRDVDGAAAGVLKRLGKDLTELREMVLNLVTLEADRTAAGLESAEGAASDRREHDRLNSSPLRRALPILVAVAVLAGGTAVARQRGYRIGRNLIVRCRQGHLFTTIWLPGVSLKSIRLGWARVQRCPVGRHWSVVTPVRDSSLTDDELQHARAHRDVRIP
jgi:ATP-dependent Clp protease ATP-binding subunit ClpC